MQENGIPFAMEHDTFSSLQICASQEQVALPTLCVAIWGLLLCRYMERESVELDCAAASGHDQALEPFALGVAVTKEDSLRSLVAAVVESHTFSPSPAALICKLKRTGQEEDDAWSLWDVVLEVEADASFRLRYDTGLHEQWYIRQIGDHLRLILGKWMEQPDIGVFGFPLLSGPEKEKILIEFNLTDTPFPQDKTLYQLFEEQAARTPEAAAVFCKGEITSFGELNAQANRLAHAIRAHYHLLYGQALLPDTPIGICMGRSAGAIITMLAILKAGGAYVPLDPDYPADRLRFMMDDARAPLVVTERLFLEKLLFLYDQDYGVISLDGGWDFISRYPDTNPEPISGPGHLAYIIYTSGSTGKPKGALIIQRGVVNYALHEIRFQGIKAGGRILASASINFDAAVLEIFPALLGGATVYLAQEEIRKDPEALFEYCREYAITRAFITPAVLHAMPKKDLPAMEVMLVGGDVCAEEDIRFWRGGRMFFNLYGPTECTVITTEQLVNEDSHHRDIGRPLSNVKAYILDEALNPVPLGVGGELYIGGEGVSRGYLNRKELTAQRFIANPFVTPQELQQGRNTTLYRSGDRVRWQKSGGIEFLGRMDFQVKIRNFRIEPGEIEVVLLSHSDVKECAVAPYEDGGEKRLAAYFVPVPGRSPSLKELRSALRQELPDYMIPSVFVSLPALPLTLNKKIDRKALPLPDPANILKDPVTGRECRTPEDPRQKEIAGVVERILNQEGLGLDDDFFELGAHSLMAARMAAELRQRFQTHVEIKDIFENPTILKLAAFLASSPGQPDEDDLCIVRATHRHFIPLTFQQEQVWFLSKLAPDNRAYNFQMTLRLEGELETGTLAAALGEIVRRHEILRTTFRESKYGPVQVVHPPWKVSIPEVDLTELPPGEREAEANRRIELEMAKSFDYTRLPLMRWVMFKLDPSLHLLLHMEHHFVHDGWSVSVFLKELKTLYGAFKLGLASPLGLPYLQYADYALWQRRYLDGPRLEAKLAYWEQRIEGYPQILELPQDHSRPAVQSFRGEMIRLDLKEPYQQLREFSRKHNVTLFDTMFSAFSLLLARYSRQDKFLVGTGVANRELKETEDMLGMFVNAVLLCPDLSGNPSFLELIDQTKQNMLRDSAHYDLPLMHIVKRLKAGNLAGRNPLFQTMFAFHDSAVPYLDFAGLHGSIGITHNATAKMDLNVVCIPRAEQHTTYKDARLEDEDVSILWEYSRDLFDQETMQGMLDNYVFLLTQLTRCPETRVLDIDMLRPGERVRLLDAAKANQFDYARNSTLHGLFLERAKDHPEGIAVIHGDATLSWRELNSRSNAVANRLRKLYGETFGEVLGPDTLIGLCLERSADMLAGMLGILKAGGAYVPLPPSYPANRLRFIIGDAKIRAVLTQEAVFSRVPCLGEEGRLVIAVDPKNLINEDESEPLNINSKDDVAYVLYTSGSTGTPKGVCIPHQAVNNFVQSLRQEAIRESDRVAQSSSHSFDGSVLEIWGGLLVAQSIVIIDSDKLENMDLLQKELAYNNVSTAFFTTALFNIIVECAPELLYALRTVAFGGEAANPACLRGLLGCKPETLTVINGYGPTECTCFSTWCLLSGRQAGMDRVPVGKPLRNYTAYLLDGKMQPVPDGVPGELYIGGDSLARGYLNRPELTSQRFLPNPFVLAEDAAQGFNTRLYKTGDIMRRDSRGDLVFLGRVDFQVKVRGFRVEPEEIEIALLRHEAVKHCVVIARELDLVAYWTPHASAVVPSAEELRSFLAATLPPFMIPAALIRLESFPLNSSFKVDRSRLPNPSQDDLEMSHNAYRPPSTRTEEIILEVWRELLHLDKISVDANFFEIGGNSLLTVRMLSGLKRHMGVEVNLSQLYSMPTIAAIAGHIDGTDITSGRVDDNLAQAMRDSRLDVETSWTSEGMFSHPRAILLTGATGFLGAYLLEALLAATKADIHCLIRGESPEERLHQALTQQGKEHLLRHKRVRPLQGDLEVLGLGLEPQRLDWLRENLDAIFHCGALVHHVYDYKRLKKANVTSTIELLSIASQGRRKIFSFISTLGTASVKDDNGATLEVEASDAPVTTNGYTLSKWVCERILGNAANRGLPVCIFRPGNISGDSVTGYCRPETNHALLRIKGCLQMHTAPDWKRNMEMVPVDLLAKAVVRLSLESRGMNIYNMNNPHEISWREYVDNFRAQGMTLNLVPEALWREKYLENVDEGNALYAIKDFYEKQQKDPKPREWKPFQGYNSTEVQDLLAKLGMHYPDNYESHMGKVITYLLWSGFLSRHY